MGQGDEANEARDNEPQVFCVLMEMLGVDIGSQPRTKFRGKGSWRGHLAHGASEERTTSQSGGAFGKSEILIRSGHLKDFLVAVTTSRRLSRVSDRQREREAQDLTERMPEIKVAKF